MKSPDYYAHPSAIIDLGAKIGKGTKIWHFCHIGPKAVIGEGCSLGQNVYVGKAKIGDGVKIQNNVSVYDEVEIEDDVFCGPSMVFTNVYNPRAAISRKDEYRKTLVKKGVTIGANATIICGITLGEYCFIGAGAVVNRDVKPYALMLGVPARQTGWMSRFGTRLNLPVTGNGKTVCPHSQGAYQLRADQIVVLDQKQINSRLS
jgi:UDP-2-acetamido-3-amino-2,3-dideoxy-glucuronate N-acetyltransferase